MVEEEKRKFIQKGQIGKEGFRSRRKKEILEKMSGEKKKRKNAREVERGRKKRLPTRLNETHREAWKERDRDCKRSSEEEDEKELQLNSIKLPNPSAERLQRRKSKPRREKKKT